MISAYKKHGLMIRTPIHPHCDLIAESRPLYYSFGQWHELGSEKEASPMKFPLALLSLEEYSIYNTKQRQL